MRSSVKEPCYMLLGCISFFTSLSFFSLTFDGFKQYDFLADVKWEQSEKKVLSTDSIIAEKEQKHTTKTLAITSENTNLEHFFMSLDSLKKTKKKIRIAHFGDSMIEGDLITSTLREEFQKEFGGSGVGFVVASPNNPSFRQSITQDFSKNWEIINVKDSKRANEIGISGYTSLTNGSSWITLNSKQEHDLLKIYYGNSTSDSALSVEVNNVKSKLPTTASFNEFAQEVHSSEIAINFLSSSSIPVYGLSVESDSGIIIDNFSFRGSSGTYFKDQDKALLMQFQEYLKYDLIIFQYGVNVASAKTTDYSWYERVMLTNIKHMKEAFPNTDFLLIGCSDRAVKTKGKYTTLKGIKPLIETQKKMAKQTGCGFLNFYELMGGKGSIEKWVNADTSLANKDYTHFNHRGAAKAGKLIYGALMSDYKNWKKKHEAI